jgi:hypothetical protein
MNEDKIYQYYFLDSTIDGIVELKGASRFAHLK